MAVDVATLRAVLVADTSAYSAGLARAGTQAQGFEKKSTRSMNKVGAAAKTMAKTGAVALGVGLAVGVKKSIDAFREQQKVSRQTDAALRSTGKAAGMSKKAIESLATALSKKTGIDDEAIQSTENLLLTFTKIKKTGGVFKQATALALDMSTALGVDAKSAAMQLGKALNDPIKGAGALARSGIDKSAIEHAKALAESGKKLQAQKYLLREVAKEFGGSAAAVATPMDHLMVTLDSLGEKIGGVVVPWLDKGAAALDNFLSSAMEGGGAGGQFMASITSGITAVKNALSGEFGTDFRNTIKTIGQEAGPIFENLGRIFNFVMNNVLVPIAKRTLPAIAQMFRGFLSVVRGVVQLISGLLSGDFRKMWAGIKQIFAGAIKIVIGMVRNSTAALRTAAAAAARGVWSGIRSVAGLVGSAGRFVIGSARDAIAGSWKLFWNVAKFIVGKLRDGIRAGIDGLGNIGAWIVSKIKAGIGGAIKIPFKLVGKISPFASGGSIKASTSGMQLVGERGPELVSLPVGSYVHNASKTKAMLGNGMTVPAFANGGRVQKMLGRAKAISNRHRPYQYGGYGNPSYDCSGYWSAIMNAGGYGWGRLDTMSFRSKLARGKGKNVTIGIRGGAGKTGHMMGAIRDGSRWRYFEAGGRGPVGEYGGWNGSFNWYHPKDDSSLNPATLKAQFGATNFKGVGAIGDPAKDNRASSTGGQGSSAGWSPSPGGWLQGASSASGGSGGAASGDAAGADFGGSGVDTASLLADIRDELRRQNAAGDATRNIVRGEIEQSVLDFFNKGIGGRLAGASRLASAGVSY